MPTAQEISLTELPEAINPKSSINDKNINIELISFMTTNTPLIYIIKKMGNIGDPYKMSDSISLYLVSCPMITN